MTKGETQKSRRYLTAKGCLATGGHKFVNNTCFHCGTVSDDGAVPQPAEGDPK